MPHEMIGGPDRPMRKCVCCMQTDDHPKDQLVLADGASAFHHHDCGAAMDPPCLSCAWLVAHKGEGQVGAAWLEQFQALHAALPDEQLELHPADRDIVAQFEGGTS